jgi:DNA helicase TIP49 (TBP-interacting protein)
MQTAHSRSVEDLDSDFEEMVSLLNLIGQKKACQALMTLVDEHHWNRIQGIQRRLRPVMLYGKCSRSVVAKAYANSLGAIDYSEIIGCLIGYGVNFQDCFGRIDEYSVCYISDIDKMAYHWKHCLLKLVRDQIIEIPEIPHLREGATKYFSGQLVLSVAEPTNISSKLEQYCSAVIKLEEYQNKDIRDILTQRIVVSGITVKDDHRVVDAIVQAVNRDVKLAVRMLEWAWRCCCAEGKEVILLHHLNKALKTWG